MERHLDQRYLHRNAMTGFVQVIGNDIFGLGGRRSVRGLGTAALRPSFIGKQKCDMFIPKLASSMESCPPESVSCPLWGPLTLVIPQKGMNVHGEPPCRIGMALPTQWTEEAS